jgi:hypothetical protein
MPCPSLRLQTHLQFSRGSAGALSFVQLLRRDGFVRLWRGANALVVACVPSHAAYFAAYELGKEKFGANLPGHHPVAAAAAGALATTLHDAVITPMDVVKQRLQLGYYRGVGHCIRTMLREEGAGSFFRSYPTTLLMNMPYAAVVVAANESLKKVLAPATGEASMTTYLLSGAGAGALAAAVTCPLDVLKTRLQTQSLFSVAAGGAGGSSAAHGPVQGAAPPLVGSAASGGAPAGNGAAGVSKLVAADGGSSRVPKGMLPTLRAQVAMLYTSPESRAPVPTSAGGSGAAAGASTASAATGSARRFIPASALSVARGILRDEGAGAFFKGVRARMAVHTPSGAISWGVYELVKSALVRRSHAAGEY